MECVYCGREIIKQKRPDDSDNSNKAYISSEHIIPNALGGLLESGNICCDNCNSLLSKQDEHFKANFSAFIPLIENMQQTRKSTVKPKHKGRGLYKGEWYDIVLEGNRPVSCQAYSKRHKTKTMPLFDVVIHEISLDNESYKKGMHKIAVNFAIHSGVQREVLADNYELIKDEAGQVTAIEFKPQFLPFIPLNSFDKYIEQATLFNLYHMIILFSANNHLYCYIDLFNTWQGYIILSSDYRGDEIYNSYVQLVQKLERPVYDKTFIRRPKDLLIFKQQYGYDENVTGTLEEQVNKILKIANEKIRQEPYERNFEDFVLEKIGVNYVDYVVLELKRTQKIPNAYSFYCYIDGREQERLRDSLFRRLTPYENEKNTDECYVYPELIWLKYNESEAAREAIREYCHYKVKRLNDFLSSNDGCSFGAVIT